MSYSKTKRSQKFARMRGAKKRKRLEGAEPDYPQELPNLRKIIVVIDFDHGKKVNVMRLYKTGRIDQYRAEANGRLWKDRIGMSGVLAGIRKSIPPVRAR